jgi:hypothetical protein
MDMNVFSFQFIIKTLYELIVACYYSVYNAEICTLRLLSQDKECQSVHVVFQNMEIVQKVIKSEQNPQFANKMMQYCLLILLSFIV